MSQGTNFKAHALLCVLNKLLDPVSWMFAFVSRHFSACAATILKPYLRTTSVKENSCSPSPAPQLLLCTTFPMKYLATSCITSIQMTHRLVLVSVSTSVCDIACNAFEEIRKSWFSCDKQASHNVVSCYLYVCRYGGLFLNRAFSFIPLISLY